MEKFFLTLDNAVALLYNTKTIDEIIPPPPSDICLDDMYPTSDWVIDSYSLKPIGLKDENIVEYYRLYVLVRIRKGIQRHFFKDSTVIPPPETSNLLRSVILLIESRQKQARTGLENSFPEIGNRKVYLLSGNRFCIQ